MKKKVESAIYLNNCKKDGVFGHFLAVF